MSKLKTNKMIDEKYCDDSFCVVPSDVYLKSEAELGLIQVLNIGEDSYRYDAETGNHPHIRCTECNRVDDIFD